MSACTPLNEDLIPATYLKWAKVCVSKLGLNETFIKILNGIEDGLDEAAIVTSLCEEYDIPAEACKTEVQEALKVLIANGYIG